MFTIRYLMLSWCVALLLTGWTAAEVPEFELSDYIGRHWQHELVEYSLDAAAVESIAGHKLTDGNGREVVYQLNPETRRIAFQADVQPYSSSRYVFAEGAASVSTDLSVTETATYIELANERTGLRLLKGLPDDPLQGPLLGWKLTSGAWTGTTRFAEPANLTSVTTVVEETGPVRAKTVTRLQFANGDTWIITCELLAGEPVVKIHERFECTVPRSVQWIFSADDGFSPAYALMRASSRHEIDGERAHDGKYLVRDLSKTEDVLLLEPWVRWGGHPARVSYFSLVDAAWQESLIVAATNAALWVDPELPGHQRAGVSSWLRRQADGGLSMAWQLARGEREYLIGSAPADVDRENWEADRRVPTQAQVHQMRHSDFPLDRVKEYVLAWESPEQSGTPFLSAEDQRVLMRNYTVTPERLVQLRRLQASMQATEELIPAYLATGDAEIERKLVDLVLDGVQVVLNQLTKFEDNHITIGYAPHHYRGFITTCNVLSLVYDSPSLTAPERTRLQGHLAFLSYIFNRDAFSSPERGYAGFPNMTACVYGVRAALAGVLPDHPEQHAWLQKASRDLQETFLDTWADEDGAFRGDQLESLDYQYLIYDIVLGAAYRAYTSGGDSETLFHPGIRNLAHWWVHSSTPRDVRIRDWRHTPPVGHVYKFSASPGLFAIVAHLYREHDPELAGWMKWMQLQQGNEVVQAVGGFVPAFAGYRKLFMDNDVEPVVPTFTSRHWTGTSVILRNHYNTPHETMLYMIAGDGHSHYDMDSGSITLWGQGEIIADDFGYYGYAPGADHSMLDSPAAPARNLMHVQSFRETPQADFVRGVKEAWTRRAMLVKDSDPEGLNYFVIHDALSTVAPADWRLWLTGQDLQIHDQHALLTGIQNMDADIYFAELPPNTTLESEEKTREPYGLNAEGRYIGRVPTTQTGIVMQVPRFERLLTLIVPRRKGTAPPVVTAIAEGRGFKVTVGDTTDYVFMSDEPIDFREGDLSVQGTAGMARVSGGKATLTLLEPGEIAYGEERLIEAPLPNEAPQSLLRGTEIFPEQPDQSTFRVARLPASPELAALGLQGEACQRVTSLDTSATKWRNALMLSRPSLVVDPQSTIRVRARVHIPGNHRVILSSYASDAAGKNVETADGKTWAWSLMMEGPTDGFRDFETTIGTAGAANAMPAEVVTLAPLLMRVYDEGEAQFYIEELVIEDVTTAAPAVR